MAIRESRLFGCNASNRRIVCCEPQMQADYLHEKDARGPPSEAPQRARRPVDQSIAAASCSRFSLAMRQNQLGQQVTVDEARILDPAQGW